jgi:subtilase family serine protease
VWEVLEGCRVDVEKNAVTAPLSHFSLYALLAVPPAPPSFTISALTISPAEVKTGETATISALVTNSGESAGEYEVVLEIDGKPAEKQQVSVPAHSAKTVTFTAALATAGTYGVKVNGLSGTLKVVAPVGEGKITVGSLSLSSASVYVGQEVAISAPVSNTGTAPITYRVGLKVDGKLVDSKEVSLAPGAGTTVSFTYEPAFAGTLKVEIEDRSASLEVKIPPSAASFSLSRLRLSTERALAGDKVVVGATVTNSGDLAGVYSAEFRVNGEVLETRTVPVEGHASREVSFTFTPDREGNYSVAINGQSLVVSVAGRFFGPWVVFGIVLAICIALITTVLVLRKSRQMYGYYDR